MLLKKLFVLVILGTFFIGASGGCFTFKTPDLSGNWEGTLRSDKNSSILARASITITNLVQDQNGNFTGGNIAITYSISNSTFQSLTASIISSESNTDDFRARIKFKGDVTPGNFETIKDIIFALTGNTISPSERDSYILTMTFPHMYGCIERDLDRLIGPYEFNIYTTGAPLGQKLDEGTATLERPL